MLASTIYIIFIHSMTNRSSLGQFGIYEYDIFERIQWLGIRSHLDDLLLWYEVSS